MNSSAPRHAHTYHSRRELKQEGTFQGPSNNLESKGNGEKSISRKQRVGTIIIGKISLWKQEVGMGKRNNQNFVSIPHARFIDMLTYKAELVGLQVEVQEESYTSKASFLDLDPIPTYQPNDEAEYTFSGKRIGRRNRLYRIKDGRIICADVNGSYNILRKSRPDAFAKGVAAYVVCAQRGA